MARKNIMWSEEDFEKVFHGLLDLKDSEPSFRVTGAWILRAMHATLPNSKHRNKIGDRSTERLAESVKAGYLVPSKRPAMQDLKETEKPSPPLQLRKPVRERLEKSRASAERIAKQTTARMRNSVSIDIQIQALVRSELKQFEPALANRVIQRVTDLIISHERTVENMIMGLERRMVDFWSGTSSEEAAEIDQQEQVKKPERKRVLIAALYPSQHQLVQHHAFAHLEGGSLPEGPRLPTHDDLEIVVLEQDQPIKGYRADAFDHVIILAQTIGHSYEKAIVSKFGKEKMQTVSKGRGPVTCARLAVEWWQKQVAAEKQS